MAPPPPGPTLRALLELLRDGARVVHLGAYSSTAQLVRDGETFQLFALHGGILGVSPEVDRPPEIGARLFEANGLDDLVGKLVGVWTTAYGTLLASNERLVTRVTGDRRRLLIELRQRWEGGIGFGDAALVLDGERRLDANEARYVAEAAAGAGGQVAWDVVA